MTCGPTRGGSTRSGASAALGRRSREPVQDPPKGRPGVEWRRVLPALTKRVRDVVDHRSPQLHLHVMPSGTFAVVVGFELGPLRIADMARVVVAAVHEVHSTDERNVVGRLGRVADHSDLLVVTTAPADPVVEQHLAAGLVHRTGEHQVLLLRVRRGVRSPHQPVHANTALREIPEHLRDLRAGTRRGTRRRRLRDRSGRPSLRDRRCTAPHTTAGNTRCRRQGSPRGCLRSTEHRRGDDRSRWRDCPARPSPGTNHRRACLIMAALSATQAAAAPRYGAWSRRRVKVRRQ